MIFVVLLPQKLLLDSDMGTEELINPPAPSGSVCGSEDNELHNSNPEPGEADSSSSNSEVKEDKLTIWVPLSSFHTNNSFPSTPRQC